MKYFFAILMLFLVIALLFSCNHADKEETTSNKLPLSIVARIGSISTAGQPRYVAGVDIESAHFDKADKIGVFMDGTTLGQWSFGIEWSPEKAVYWPDKEVLHDFCAFYPYAESSSLGKVPMPSLKAQKGTLESVAKYDFMVATTKQSYVGNNGEVDFVGEDHCFKHQLSIVSLKIEKTEALTDAVLIKAAIGAKGLWTESTYSFLDNSVHYSDVSDDSMLELSLNKKMDEEDVLVYFIMNSKPIDIPVSLTLSYVVGDKTYTAETNNLTTKAFQSGNCYSCTIQVRDGKLILTGGEVSNWDSGESLGTIVIDGKEESNE